MKFDPSLNLNKMRESIKNEIQLTFAYKVAFHLNSFVSGQYPYSKKLNQPDGTEGSAWYPLNININNFQITGNDIISAWYGQESRVVPTGSVTPSIIELTFPFNKSMEPYTSFQEWVTSVTGQPSSAGSGSNPANARYTYQDYAYNNFLQIWFLNSDGTGNRRIEYREVFPMGISKQTFNSSNVDQAISTYNLTLASSITPNIVP